MNLLETFKLFEDMWDDTSSSDDYGTSSLQVGFDGQQGVELLNQPGLPHAQAYELLLKVLKSAANKDLTELYIYWTADSQKPGDHAGDGIVMVDSLQYLIDLGEDIEDAKERGYDLRIPVHRLILPGTYTTEDLGIPENAFDVIEAALTPAKKPRRKTYTEMYIVLNEGGTDGVIHYMGTHFKAAERVYRSTARSYVRGGFGGGDSTVSFYQYTGPDDIFDDLYKIWKKDRASRDLYYTNSIEDLGFSPAYCELIDATDC